MLAFSGDLFVKGFGRDFRHTEGLMYTVGTVYFLHNKFCDWGVGRALLNIDGGIIDASTQLSF